MFQIYLQSLVFCQNRCCMDFELAYQSGYQMYAIMGQIIWLLSFFLRVSGCYHDQQSSYLLSLSWNPRGCRLLASTWTSTCTGAWPESHIFRTEVVVVMACWIFHPAVLLQLSVPCDFWFCIFFTSTTKLLFVLVFFLKNFGLLKCNCFHWHTCVSLIHFHQHDEQVWWNRSISRWQAVES